jgi:hypothetical protein
MQPHDEQSQDQQSGQPAPSPYSEAPEPANHPVVTLSPDEGQTIQTVYPVAASSEEAPVKTSTTHSQPVRWQATEYIHRERDQAWFALFVVVTIILIAAAIFLIKSITFAILIPVMAAALVVYTRRPPRVLDYTLSRQGLHINDQLYPFAEFKSFALVHGINEYSIMLIPTKRFKPAVSIYFPEEAGEAIVDMLAARLPMQETRPDVVDRLIQKLHL